MPAVPALGRAVTDSQERGPAVPATEPQHRALADPFLALAAAQVSDLERTRIAAENRLRQLTRVGEDKDGHERGLGMDETHPDVARTRALVDALAVVEHDAVLTLNRTLRRHPLGPWVKATIGVGEKQGARLLAAIGDPYVNSATGQPRTVSALWAYSGLHVVEGVAAKRRKGVKSNWSPDAKMRAYLVAESCIKQARSPYRAVYDGRRAHTLVTHPEWTPGHSHADALRVVSKAVLRGLWVEARRLHGVS